MPVWLVYMETYSIDFLTPSFIIHVSNPHHQQDTMKNVAQEMRLGWEAALQSLATKQMQQVIYVYIYIYIYTYI
jgi:hypothetical protein